MKNIFIKFMPAIIIAFIIYFCLLLFVHSQFMYIYNELFVDEWIVMSVITILYIVAITLLSFIAKFIFWNKERRKLFISICVAIVVLFIIKVGMDKYWEKQEAKRQEQLRKAEEDHKWIEESYKQIQKDYLDADIKAMENSQKNKRK